MVKKVYSIRISEELKDDIDSLAKDQHRSFNNMVELILLEYKMKHKGL